MWLNYLVFYVVQIQFKTEISELKIKHILKTKATNFPLFMSCRIHTMYYNHCAFAISLAKAHSLIKL